MKKELTEEEKMKLDQKVAFLPGLVFFKKLPSWSVEKKTKAWWIFSLWDYFQCMFILDNDLYKSICITFFWKKPFLRLHVELRYS